MSDAYRQKQKEIWKKCVYVSSSVCEAHKIPVWIFAWILFFFPGMNVLVSFSQMRTADLIFHSSFLIPWSSLSFSFISLRSGQVRFQESSKIIIVIYLGKLRVEAWQKFWVVRWSWWVYFNLHHFDVALNLIFMNIVCNKVNKILPSFSRHSFYFISYFSPHCTPPTQTDINCKL